MSDWWARKMAGEVPGARMPVAPANFPAALPRERYIDPRYQQQYPQQPAAPAAPAKAMSARSTALCPHCASGNFMAPPGGGPSRCFDCGYPVVQSTSGLMGDPGAASTPAEQVATAPYNPTVEGHIS